MELENICNALAEDVFEMSDEEIEAEILEDGDDTEEIREVLLRAIYDKTT
jgi:ferredoxin